MRREIVFALLNGLNLGVVIMNLPPVLSELMELYGVSYTQISFLLSALLWPHAAMQLPAGMITDPLGVRRTQLLSLACMSLGNALPVVSPDLRWGVGGRMITGLGTGMGWLATLKLLAMRRPAGGSGPTRHSSPTASRSGASWRTWECPSSSGPDGTGCSWSPRCSVCRCSPSSQHCGSGPYVRPVVLSASRTSWECNHRGSSASTTRCHMDQC